jgi:hypothetical protein
VDLTFEGTAGAIFEIPPDLITFRSGRRKLSPEQAEAAAEPISIGRDKQPRLRGAFRPKWLLPQPARHPPSHAARASPAIRFDGAALKSWSDVADDVTHYEEHKKEQTDDGEQNCQPLVLVSYLRLHLIIAVVHEFRRGGLLSRFSKQASCQLAALEGSDQAH